MAVQVGRVHFTHKQGRCSFISFLGVVHAVTYSILLLNTDLHVADLSTHMSRNQFVRNTLQAVQAQNRPQPSLARASTPDLTYDDASSTHARSDGSDIGGSTLKSPKRSSSVHSWTSISRENLPPSQVASPLGPPSQNASSISVQTPTSGSMSAVNEPRIRTSNSQSSSVSSIPYGRNWDLEMENILRVRISIFMIFTVVLKFGVLGYLCCRQGRGNSTTCRLPDTHESVIDAGTRYTLQYSFAAS